MNKVTNILFLTMLFSCSVLKRKGSWGKDALWPVKGSSVWDAAKKNALSAHVWVPLVGAGTINWAGWDHKISHWANNGQRIYDDQTSADNWSDDFNDILKYEVYLTTLLTPSLDEGPSWGGYAANKFRGALVVNAAGLSSSYAHDRLAKAAHRKRPNRKDFRSFPSGHSTDAASRNRINSKNLDYIEMNHNLRFGIKTVNTTMAAGTLWARLEGRRHFPSDVLCGYALGSFLSGFVYDALMNAHPQESFLITPTGRGEVSAQYTYAF